MAIIGGDMTPPPGVAAAAELMGGFGRPWALCGGWSVDAWLGRVTREHPDLDLAISIDDQGALRGHLADGWLLNGHDPPEDDSTAQWDGHELGWPSHIHARGHAHGHQMNLDYQLEWRAGDDWRFREEPPLTMPIVDAIRDCAWGVPILAPEVTLFFKGAGEIRPHDEADFQALAPTLDRRQRGWLADALAGDQRDHPWLEILA